MIEITCKTCLRGPERVLKPGCATCSDEFSNWLPSSFTEPENAEKPLFSAFNPASLLRAGVAETSSEISGELAAQCAQQQANIPSSRPAPLVAMAIIKLMRDCDLSWADREACADVLCECLRLYEVIQNEERAQQERRP